MTDTLHELLIEPVSGLAHRVRHPASGQKRPPCLILLHGVGANETGFIQWARRIAPRMTVVLARGPLTFGPGQFGWFQVQFTQDGPAIDAAQAEHSRARLLSFIGALPEAYGIDPARIWIAGFSQGGIMSASVALTAPASVAGFGLLSGRILPEILPHLAPAAALRQTHAFVSHGTEDQKLGVHFARDARHLLRGLDLPLDYHEYPTGHTLDASMTGDFERWLGEQIERKPEAEKKAHG